MLHTTRAIVLRTIRHGDRTTVLKAFTERAGLRSYLVRVGGRSGLKHALLAPLARLELVVQERPERDLHRVHEARVEAPLENPGDPVRSSVLLFTQDILLRTLKEESHDLALFQFVHDHIGRTAEAAPEPYAVHRFLLNLSRHLGFQPSPAEETKGNFDLLEGCFLAGDAPRGHTLRPPLSTGLAALISGQPPGLTPKQRSELLDHLLLYFRLHVEGFGELRSLEVLRQSLA